jgi:hypothetical protein
MPARTEKDKETGFPVLQFVRSHMWTLLRLPTRAAIEHVKVGHLKVK